MRIVILDVDGVMIPATQLLVDPQSSNNRTMPATTVAVLNEICRRTGALIVFNTSHNVSRPGQTDIVEAAVANGVKAEYIHPDSRTKMPRLDREVAAFEYLGRHPEIEEWLAFDDALFTDDDRLILVHPQAGLHTGHLDQVLDRWNLPPMIL